jgi:hypothetical protein
MTVRNAEIRIRLTPEEKDIIESFIRTGKTERLWTNRRTMLNKLIEYWKQGHVKGKFIQ